jgi:isochorismate synthase/2-succinyl-5-enolpyruvyl-6-hydroxy-3-cyclohexene-1-carboxylate synthase/2-succinyl-6-hydroxy-2,4-cyclohexadiene-1-carboxylate synthase/O-succinylbenzoate synthase
MFPQFENRVLMFSLSLYLLADFQVNHFGNYVRYYFDLPPATDEVSARMVLTTIDTAVFLANSSPSGPVHINCPFREPISGIKEPWNPTCLQGIERWVMDKSPFTTYVGSMTRAPSNYGIIMGQRLGRFAEILKVIKSATRGLLVVGGLHNSEETWAVILLARHLGFPVVPDVLSGLRSLGNVFSMGNSDDRLTILQNFDQLLLSRTAAEAIAPDVILQVRPWKGFWVGIMSCSNF